MREKYDARIVVDVPARHKAMLQEAADFQGVHISQIVRWWLLDMEAFIAASEAQDAGTET